ncbi:MAG: hypothetical protein AB1552_10360 [Nitrospirota bacterium]
MAPPEKDRSCKGQQEDTGKLTQRFSRYLFHVFHCAVMNPAICPLNAKTLYGCG